MSSNKKHYPSTYSKGFNKNNDTKADSESSSSGENPELKPRCINPESP